MEWVQSMLDWLQRQVITQGIRTTDQWLWDSTLVSFTRQYADNLQQEKATMNLRQGIKMQGQDIDGYIAHFEELVRHAQYDINAPQTIDMFTRGLPTALYEKVYEMDTPTNFEEWRRASIKRQGVWFHMNGGATLKGSKTTTPPKNNNAQRPFYAPNRHPDAMDVDRT